jgi:hypothetical protein
MNLWEGARNNPMMDFSSSLPLIFASFSRRLRINKSLDISPKVTPSFLKSFVRLLGILAMIGNTVASRKKARFTTEACRLFPKASNTSVTLARFPSSDPKSWEKPAMPIVSSLIICQLEASTARYLRVRYMIYPSSHFDQE